MKSHIITSAVIRLVNRLTLQKIPLGRWTIIHPNTQHTKLIMDRKIDLANHDSCYCNSVIHCIESHDKVSMNHQYSNKK